MTADLTGRVALVTGAGKGLGRAYALHLAACGAAVVVNNRAHADGRRPAQAVVDAIVAAGGRAIANDDAVDDPACGQRMVHAALAAFGHLDILVANAGIAHFAAVHKTPADEWQRQMAVNFFGALHPLLAVLPVMRAQGHGRIVLTTSTAGLLGAPALGPYGAAKAAVYALARTVAQENAKGDVRCNVLAPYARTDMNSFFVPEAAAARLDPAHVAPLVAWLASTACPLNGETLIGNVHLVRRAALLESAGAPLAAGWPAIAAMAGAREIADGGASLDDFIRALG